MGITVSIIGATGYSGQELLSILIRHQNVEKVFLVSRGEAGKLLDKKYNKVSKKIYPQYLSPDNKLLHESSVVFFATPNGTALNTAKTFYDKGILIIDLSADFRLKNSKEYQKWYGAEHTQAQMLAQAVYGLPEIYRQELDKTKIIANPGCYATATQLGLYPLIKNDLIETNNIIVDGKSGTSGAGKKLEAEYMFCEVNETLRAYAISGHRHHAEITQTLNLFSKTPIELTFVPHLIPMQRGILVTIYCRKKAEIDEEQIRLAFNKVYKNANFVRVLDRGLTPSTADVSRSNFCDLGINVDCQNNRVVITSAIDNMVKGAAGQAVQNMNINLGFNEKMGLI